MRYPGSGSDAERARFASLQHRLLPLYRRVFTDRLAPRTVVVIPSLSLDTEVMAKIPGAPHYEERLLCLLMLLRLPRTRVVYVTSVAIHPTIIDYYLHLLAGVPHSHARQRLTLITCGDPSTTPLTAKVLANRSLIRRLRSATGDQALAHMACFNVTSLERTLSVRLDILIYGCDPDLAGLGSKSGSRSVFRAAGIQMPDGFDDLRDAEDIAWALAELKRRQPALASAAVKLNEGFSGEGNALFRYREDDVGVNLDRRIKRRLGSRLRFESDGETWEPYRTKFAEMGGIVEAFVTGRESRSPSVQCRIDPRKRVEVVSTHEQVLGGPSGQVFLGCEFPARSAYRVALQDAAVQVAKELRDRGVLGRFSVDFVATRQGRTWRTDAIEINLRKGGTTHPFLMLDFLTGGSYQRRTGVYQTPAGQARCYVATDNLQQSRYVGLSPDDLVDLSVANELHFSGASQEGVVFHLIGALEEFGKLGIVCIGATLPRARRLFDRTVAVLDTERPRDT